MAFAFQPRGGAASTVSIAVTASAQAVGLPVLAAESCTVRLVNAGTQTVFIAFTGTAVAATSMPMLANTVEVFSMPNGSALSVIAAATGSTLYATVGDGQ
jgi:hypothetical protein